MIMQHISNPTNAAQKFNSITRYSTLAVPHSFNYKVTAITKSKNDKLSTFIIVERMFY